MNFFALIFRQRYIKRWSLMRNSEPENLCEHSAQTAVLAHALALIGNRRFGRSYDADRAATLALYHDAAEVYTGDLPTPVKYFSPEMREQYRRIEDTATSALIERLPPDLRGDYAALLTPSPDDAPLRTLVKAADKLCSYIKCVEETSRGNGEFSAAAGATLAAMRRLNCPELDCFISEFLPSFTLTLDELQK